MKANILTNDRIIIITNRFRKVYIALLCIGTLTVISDILGVSENVSKSETWQAVINLLLYLIIYAGLRLKTKWLIPLALISSAWFLMSTFLSTLQPVVDIPGLIAKVLGMIFFLFFAYQMHFFSKREVKIYFGTEGTVFF
jgi:hypothetical protein